MEAVWVAATKQPQQSDRRLLSEFERGSLQERAAALSFYEESFMSVILAPRLSSDLKPLCPRDNHVMKFESSGSKENIGLDASYHCGLDGCSVRYSIAEGYHTLNGTTKHTYAVDEPGVNIFQCPIHGLWLYRRDILVSEPGVRWCCGAEGCDAGYESDIKGI